MRSVSRLKVLAEGRPGVGKTTLARRLVDSLEAQGVPLSGFTTEEMRSAGRRTGFAIETVAGERGVLAHVDLSGPPRVGRYGVDLETLERLALPAVSVPGDAVVVVDELGKMELASAAFREAVAGLFDSDKRVVATVHVFKDPLTDALKHRHDVEVVQVSQRTRDDLADALVHRLVR
jgi:nucleoside-triphosphatase